MKWNDRTFNKGEGNPMCMNVCTERVYVCLYVCSYADMQRVYVCARINYVCARIHYVCACTRGAFIWGVYTWINCSSHRGICITNREKWSRMRVWIYTLFAYVCVCMRIQGAYICVWTCRRGVYMQRTYLKTFRHDTPTWHTDMTHRQDMLRRLHPRHDILWRLHPIPRNRL